MSLPIHQKLTRPFRAGVSLSFLTVLCFTLPTQAARSPSPWKPKFEGKFTLAPMYSSEDLGQGTSQADTWLRLEPEFSLRYRKDFRVRLAPILLANPSSASSSEKFFPDVAEASFEWKFDSLKARAGIIPYSWGVTDVFNPLDVVGSRRYFDPLNSERRGSPSVSLQYEVESWRVEVAYIPSQLPSVLPGEKSRWLPRDIAINPSADYSTIELPKDLRYHYHDAEVFDRALQNNYGLQIERRGDGLDLTAMYFEGAPTAPVILPELTGTVVSIPPAPEVIVFDPDVYLRPTYYRRRTTGAGAVLTFDSTIVRMAGAYSDRVGEGRGYLPGWTQSGVLGIEQSMGVGDATLVILLQGSFANHEDQADNSATSLDRIFDRSLLLGMRLATSTSWTLSAAILRETLEQGMLGQIKGDIRLGDGWLAGLGVDVLDGPTGSALGSYRKNDRIHASLSFIW